MSRVCVLLADGFEEIEAVTLIDVLRRAHVEVVTLGVRATRVVGSHAIALEADALLDAHAGEDWDMVILPGGMPGAKNLRDDPTVQALLRRQHARGARLAAICAAPIALSAAGVLAGRRATSYPAFESEVACGHYETDAVVVDGHVATSRGPGTALAFALRLCAELGHADAAANVARGMLVVPA